MLLLEILVFSFSGGITWKIYTFKKSGTTNIIKQTQFYKLCNIIYHCGYGYVTWFLGSYD